MIVQQVILKTTCRSVTAHVLVLFPRKLFEMHESFVRFTIKVVQNFQRESVNVVAIVLTLFVWVLINRS